MTRTPPRASSAFTLVELLVVVSIITMLIALLLPGLRQARETTRIAKCVAQLHQMGVGLVNYGSDNFGHLPDGNATRWPSRGIDAVWCLNGAVAQPMGLAFLITLGYTPDARIYYCPSSTHPYMQYNTMDTAGIDPLRIGPNQFGGWPAPGKTGPPCRGISYNYRSTFGLIPRRRRGRFTL